MSEPLRRIKGDWLSQEEMEPSLSLDEALSILQMNARNDKPRGNVTMSVADAWRIITMVIQRERERTRLPLLSSPSKT